MHKSSVMSQLNRPIITRETLLPLGLILTVSGTLFGAVVWITNLYNLSKNNAEKITVIQSQAVDTQKDIKNYNERVIRIEEKIDVLLQTQGINANKIQ